MINDLINAAGGPAVIGSFVAGGIVTSGAKLMRVVCKILWREFCMFAAKMHVPQKAVDQVAVAVITDAAPKIDAALADAQAALKADESTTEVTVTTNPEGNKP